MFSNLIFIIIILLLGNFVPINQETYFADPLIAFGVGLALFLLLLGIIVLQNRLLTNHVHSLSNHAHFIANIEILAFLCVYTFFLNANSLFEPYLWHSIVSFIPLLFYFIALWVFHYTDLQKNREVKGSSSEYATRQIFLVMPFVFSFVTYLLLVDLYKYLDFPEESWVIHIGSVIYIIAMFIIIPPLTQWLWRCKPLNNPPLEDRLDLICRKAKFSHGGFKTWTVLNNSLTAAIMGIVPRFRYILFTKRLLNTFSIESIEAILAHEIGHSYHKHLYIYPLILFGMVQVAGLIFILFGDTIAVYTWLHPDEILMVSFIIFAAYALIISIYFRYVFGYFSRLFERQADLHVYRLQMPVQNMIDALDHVGIATGFTHEVPNWHHYSIRDRMNFLKRTEEEPRLINKHHRRVKVNVGILFLFLTLVTLVMLAPFFPEIWPFKIIDEKLSQISIQISEYMNEFF